MKEIEILCWNVNGVRAVEKKGFLEWLNRESPDILCLQETKAQPDQISPELEQPPGYYAHWNFPERKGYSGVATFTKEKPIKVENGFGIEQFDVEGRVISTQYPQFTLFNIYFPNGKMSEERLKYKMGFYDAFLDFVDDLKAKGEKLIICGDFNTAHKEIDLARPKENEAISGFLPVEREWMDKFVAHGFIDTFRYFNNEPNHYTWWSVRTRARERNIGWRLDYFFVSEDLIGSVTETSISSNVMGSDHCPVGVRLSL
ncbi:MAG: exodeoxyribonuclease III [Dehalococcoidia bacterium]|nr:exodeoxyribonuclease III [Dehalococcoidia bacterium]